MLPLLIALTLPAQAKAPDLGEITAISVEYTMKTSGTNTCETVFKGTGTDPVVSGDAVTFSGTWSIVSDSCKGATIWAPEDGKAHHTLRLKDKDFDEWIVHASAGDTTRFESNIAARGQYWINELGADAKSDTVAYTTSEKQGIGPLSIEITHDLKIELTRGTAPEAESEAP